MNTFNELYEKEIENIIKYCKLAYWRKLVSAAGGNISIRIGDNILITASNVSMRDVTANTLLLCDIDGKVLDGNSVLKPSKETKFHLAVYKNRPEVGAVIHVHPRCSTAFSVTGEELPLYTASARMKLVSVPFISEAGPGSTELFDKVEQAVKSYADAPGYIMRNHGILTMGKTLKESFDYAELIEETANIAILVKSMSPGQQ